MILLRPQDTIHKVQLTRLLTEILDNPTLSQNLYFKGGTCAAMLGYLDRFSVDLDFDLLDETKEDYVFGQIKKILESYGTLKEASKKRFNLSFILSYKNKDLNAQNVKVDINRRNFGSQYEVKSYLGISMKVMVEEDITANKLVAMYERFGKTNRDIFDVWFFLHNNWPVNKKLVECRTSLMYKEFLQKCIDSLEKVSNKNILSGMGELLDEKQKNWVKSKLKTETIFLLKLGLENEK